MFWLLICLVAVSSINIDSGGFISDVDVISLRLSARIADRMAKMTDCYSASSITSFVWTLFFDSKYDEWILCCDKRCMCLCAMQYS